MESLAENLKDLIDDMPISKFAKIVKIPQPTLSRYLACKRQITLENLVILADYFNIDIDVLVGRKEY